MKDGVGHIIINAIKEYIAEVKLREFPSKEYYYKLKDEELKKYIFELSGGK
jgi:ketopantoate hydroxymethyltransferase